MDPGAGLDGRSNIHLRCARAALIYWDGQFTWTLTPWKAFLILKRPSTGLTVFWMEWHKDQWFSIPAGKFPAGAAALRNSLITSWR